MDRPDPFPVRRFGRYVLIDRLAVGGMAEVFVAFDTDDTERLLVVKRILDHLAQNPEFVDSFAREATLAAGIHHPNVIRIVELGDAEGVPFIVMEYVEGVTLKELLAAARHSAVEAPGLPITVALHLVLQACAGSHAAHELLDADGRPYGLVHRDITPHNLMVDEHGHVKLLDFGIAKACEGMDQTRTGVLKGKISYMAPEQCRQERLDRRADVFSLGVVTYQLLTGEKPFSGTSELATMQAIILGKYRPIRELRPEVPPALAAAVERALSVEADHRPATAVAFGKLLTEAAHFAGLDLHPGPAEEWIRRTLGAPLRGKRAAVERARAQTLTSISDSGATPSPPALWTTGAPRIREMDPRGPTPVVTPSVRGGADFAPPRPSPPRTPPRPPSGAVRSLSAAAGMLAALALVGASIQWVSENSPALDAIAATAGIGGPPLTIVLSPTSDSAPVLSELEPVRLYLEAELGRAVAVDFAEDYRQAADAVISGEADFGLLDQGTVVYALEVDPELEVIAVAEIARTWTSDGLLLVRTEGSVKVLDDLKGPRSLAICYVDPLSGTGYDLPRRFLHHHGVDPDRLYSHVSGNHDQVLRDLLDGTCDVAATDSASYLAAWQRGIYTTRLTLLAHTGTAANQAIVASRRVPQEVADAVREILLGFDLGRGGANPDGHSISGFVAPPDPPAPPPDAARPSR